MRVSICKIYYNNSNKDQNYYKLTTKIQFKILFKMNFIIKLIKFVKMIKI